MNNHLVTQQLWAFIKSYTIHPAPEVLAESMTLTLREPPERGGTAFPGSLFTGPCLP